MSVIEDKRVQLHIKEIQKKSIKVKVDFIFRGL